MSARQDAVDYLCGAAARRKWRPILGDLGVRLLAEHTIDVLAEFVGLSRLSQDPDARIAELEDLLLCAQERIAEDDRLYAQVLGLEPLDPVPPDQKGT